MIHSGSRGLGHQVSSQHPLSVPVPNELYDYFVCRQAVPAEDQLVSVIMLIAQVATDALVSMEKAMARDGIHVNDRQVAMLPV